MKKSYLNYRFVLFVLILLIQIRCTNTKKRINNKSINEVQITLFSNEDASIKDSINLFVTIKSVSSKSLTINKNIILSTLSNPSETEVEIIILKNNIRYVQNPHTCLRPGPKQKLTLKPGEYLEKNLLLNFKDLIKNVPLNKEGKYVENKNFGNYNIQAVGIFGLDTILSNVISVEYISD